MKNKQKQFIKEKKIDASKTLKLKELEAIKDNKSDDNENPLKYIESFEELSNERLSEKYNISKQIGFKNLVFYFKSKGITPINFIDFIIIIIINKYLYRANSSVVILCTKLYTIYTLLSWRPCKT